MTNESSSFLTRPAVICGLAMVCCILWGSAFPCVKIGYEMFHIADGDVGSQILFGGMRFFLSGIITVLIGWGLEKKFPWPKKESWWPVTKLGFVQTFVQYIFFYIGLANTTGVKASIIESSNVFIAILIPSLLLRQEKLTLMKIFGCIVGFVGVVLINLNGSSLDMTMKVTGEGFIFLAAVSYAVSFVMTKEYAKKESTFVLCGYQFIVGGAFMILVGGCLGGRVSGFTPLSTGLFLYLATLSAVAYYIWAQLLKYNPVGKVSVYGFMNPVCGVILSALLLQEGSHIWGFYGIAALVLVCLGIYLVNREDRTLDSNDGSQGKPL